MTTSDITIVRIDPLDGDLVDSWIDAWSAVYRHDFPAELVHTPAFQRLRLLLPPASYHVERHAAVLEGAVVGCLELFMPLDDNRHLVSVELGVRPEHRRRGIGTALLALAERRAAASDRDTLLTGVIDSLDGGVRYDPAGRRFAEARGYAEVDSEIHRRNDLTLVDEAELDRLYAEAWEHAAGYELVQWSGRAPDDLVEGVARMRERMYTDPPMGEELDIRPAEYDAARVRAEERVAAARGELRLASAVRHVETGEVAGFTDLLVFPGDEEHAGQNDTIVDAAHRGKRLGTILKIANQRLLREHRPKVRYVHTWNAEANRHMIAVNEAVGYRAMSRAIDVQKKLA